MSGSAFAVTHHAFSSGAGRTSDGNGSHASTLKLPSYTKSVSWQHYRVNEKINPKFKLNQIGKSFFVDNYESHIPITKKSILTSISDYIEKEQGVRF